jgi:hypothetical protein
MSGPRRRKLVGPIVSRVTWHGGRGRQRSRWAFFSILLGAGELAGQIAALDRPEREERELAFVENPVEHRLDLVGPHTVDRGEHRVD